MSKKNWTRRAFLAATTSSVLASTGAIRVNAAEVVPGKKSPNGKLLCAGIGVGGKGLSDIMECKREKVIAMCDVDWKRAEEAFYRIPEAKKFKDYREMLSSMPEIDAVTISTPDHTHAPAAFMAMNMGKHVYVQKPLTHTIAEARMLTKLAVKTGVATQMGNQGHSNAGVRDLCEMVWDGALGEIKEVHAWTNRPIWPQGITDPLPGQPVPETMDWNLWIGTAPEREYNEKYAPFNWRGWWDFGCGAIGDMACHIMDAPFWACKLNEAKTYTVETIQQEGMNAQTAPNKSITKFEIPARGDMAPVTLYWYDGGLLPERPADLPDDVQMGGGDNGSMFIGTEGYAMVDTYGHEVRFYPEEKFADYKKPEEIIPRVRSHSRNWLDGCKGKGTPCSHFEYAGLLTELANMGNVALHAGKKIAWDSEQFTFTNDAELNKLLTKDYRKGWEIPA